MNVTLTIPDGLVSGILYAGYALVFTLAALLLVLAIVGIIYRLMRWRRCWGMATAWLTFRKVPAEKWTMGMLRRVAELVAEDCPEEARGIATFFNEEAAKHERSKSRETQP